MNGTHDTFTLFEASGKLYTRSDEGWEGISNPLASFRKVSSGRLEQLAISLIRSIGSDNSPRTAQRDHQT